MSNPLYRIGVLRKYIDELEQRLEKMTTDFEKVSVQFDQLRKACLDGLLNKKRRNK